MSLICDNQDNIFCHQLDIKVENEYEKPDGSYGYNINLNNLRTEIDKIDSNTWKKVRWFINHYDFKVSSPIINRAFYKYWEIIHKFYLFDNFYEDDTILHCAEAPGGFIQGSSFYIKNMFRSVESTIDEDGFISVKQNKQLPLIWSISLNKDNKEFKNSNLPSYNEDIIKKNVIITYGKDNTGDITNIDNIEHIHNLSKKKFHLITADGGFDEGIDFNNKEQLHYTLILSEINAAIKLQKENGNFILKVFDIYTQTSAHMIFLLTLCYTSVEFYKPKTSRPTNSEKYVICKGFKLNNTEIMYILDFIKDLLFQLKNNKGFSKFTIFKELPHKFKIDYYKTNSNMALEQIKNLSKSINLCYDKNFIGNYDSLLYKDKQIRKNVFNDWKKEYNYKF